MQGSIYFFTNITAHLVDDLNTPSVVSKHGEWYCQESNNID